ncbi:MAG: hypothetical protein ACK4ON_07385 [Bacteroidia bacterium]
MTKFNYLLALTISCGLLLSSCGNDEAENQNTTETTTEVIEAETAFILPSPLQVASIFKNSGMGYVAGIGNDFNNESKYTTNVSKFIALGVYSGDLAYYSLNKQKQDAINCLNTIRKISGGIGLETIFGNKEILENFEKNIDNEDSLAYVIAEIQMELDSYLTDNEINHLSSVIFASAWVESMYLGSKSTNDKNKQGIANQLSQQYLILENLTKALNKAAQVNAGFAPLASEISTINDLFNSFEYLKNKDNDDVTATITDEELAKLTAKIEEVRKKLVEGAIS